MTPQLPPILRALRILWASPWSLLGLAAGAAFMLLGGSCRRTGMTLDFTLRRDPRQGLAWLRRWPFRAVTLGHVLLALTSAELEVFRPHELVHVRQYERWGPAFLPAYLLASAWVWLKGGQAYWDNPFEIEARALGVPGNAQANARAGSVTKR
jgi:hypothetical protein